MERVWVYQSNRILRPDEVLWLEGALKGFVEQWNSHGTSLAASAEIRYDLFVILKVDQALTPSSGCSIDSSVHFLKKVEEHLGISLFDRMQVSFQDTAGRIHVVNRVQFETLIREAKVDANTLVFNNLIQSAEELENDWLIPMHKSWHIKVFDNVPYNA